ncbi:MAG: hypothetical protein HOQ10_13900 [Frateuria sp.]|nr:hypothetical protein [Frateuria sp.]
MVKGSRSKVVVLSVLAVLAGIVVNIVLSLALDALFQRLGVLPAAGQAMTDAQHVLPFSYRVLIALLGFYATARLAPVRPMRHAMVLAAIAFALTLMTTLASWNSAHVVQPHWFQLSMLLLLFPLAWLGGWMGNGGRRELNRQEMGDGGKSA